MPDTVVLAYSGSLDASVLAGWGSDVHALIAFVQNTQRYVTGEVILGLYKATACIMRWVSPNSLYSLYDEPIASTDAGCSNNQTDAEGFLRIMGFPSRVRGRSRKRDY